MKLETPNRNNPFSSFFCFSNFIVFVIKINGYKENENSLANINSPFQLFIQQVVTETCAKAPTTATDVTRALGNKERAIINVIVLT